MKIFKKFSKPVIDSFTIISNIKNFNPSKDSSIKIKNEVLHFIEVEDKNRNNDYIIYQAQNKSFFNHCIKKVVKAFGFITVSYYLWTLLKNNYPNMKLPYLLHLGST